MTTPVVPEGIELSWETLAFMATGATVIFLAAWQVFSMRTRDHVKFDDKIDKRASELEVKFTEKLNSLDIKIDAKFEATVNAIGRVEASNKEDYSVLHGRVNRSVEELGEVEAKVEYQRGVTDTMKDFMLHGEKRNGVS